METVRSEGAIGPSGQLGLSVVRAGGQIEVIDEPLGDTLGPDEKLDFKAFNHFAAERKSLHPEVNAWRRRNWHRVFNSWSRINMAMGILRGHAVILVGSLYLVHRKADGEILDLGLASMRVVTTAGATYIVDDLRAAGAQDVTNFKYHALGTGTNAEAIGDTALQTEATTQYNPDNTRATGSQTNNGAKVYRTVGTNTVDASLAATEHGILTQAATGGGTLLDRSVFTVVNLASGDGLQSTYDFTVNDGG